MNDLRSQRRPRRTMFLLAVLFILPVAGAWWLHFHPQWQPRGRTNYGQLVDPARTMPEIRYTMADGKAADTGVFRQRWSYVYLGGAVCDLDCRAKLIQIRQIRLRLGDKMPRVQRIYVAPDLARLQAAKALVGADNPDLIFIADTGEPGHRAADFFRSAAAGAANDIYLTDPLANWLMIYPADAQSAGIYKDIKHLLLLSHIG